jgi:hypothetical protein
MDLQVRRRTQAAALVTAGVVGGVVVAGLATANAQTSPTPSPSTGTQQAPPQDAPGGPGPGGRGHGGRGGGFGPSIHGEFTTPAPNGGYQTVATQAGEVTAVSASSVTVKSEDGYSRTYGVDDNTLVNAGNDGIADVKKGDDVRVTAIVSGGTAKAVEVNDGTNIGELRGRWQPGPPPGAPGAPDQNGTAAPSGAAAT